MKPETDYIWSTGQVIIVPNKMVIYFNTDKFMPGTIKGITLLRNPNNYNNLPFKISTMLLLFRPCFEPRWPNQLNFSINTSVNMHESISRMLFLGSLEQ